MVHLLPGFQVITADDAIFFISGVDQPAAVGGLPERLHVGSVAFAPFAVASSLMNWTFWQFRQGKGVFPLRKGPVSSHAPTAFSPAAVISAFLISLRRKGHFPDCVSGQKDQVFVAVAVSPYMRRRARCTYIRFSAGVLVRPKKSGSRTFGLSSTLAFQLSGTRSFVLMSSPRGDPAKGIRCPQVVST